MSFRQVKAASLSSNDPSTQKWVKVAVLAPSVVHGGQVENGGKGIYGVNSSWNSTATREPHRKSFLQSMGLKSEKQVSVPDRPPHVMRNVPYDTWRKHYAKDVNGYFVGTSTPARDCLLKPEDLQKWRAGEQSTPAEKWTRGDAALPTYADIGPEESLPAYDPTATPSDEPVVDLER